MRRILKFSALLTIASSVLSAQDRIRPELRPFAGVCIPTADQRDVYKTAPMLGLQGAVEVRPTLHVLGSFAWISAEHGELGSIHIIGYDAGIELSGVRDLASGMLYRPFVGLGGGARSYLYPGRVRDRTGPAGYAALGMELQRGRGAFRFEGRLIVFRNRATEGGDESKTLNDIALMVGYSFHLR
jgi:hypothetical protein